mgnify:FL=1
MVLFQNLAKYKLISTCSNRVPLIKYMHTNMFCLCLRVRVQRCLKVTINSLNIERSYVKLCKDIILDLFK